MLSLSNIGRVSLVTKEAQEELLQVQSGPLQFNRVRPAPIGRGPIVSESWTRRVLALKILQSSR